MDNGAHRENGRPKPPQPQGQYFVQHPPSMKQIMAIMAERDRAIQERNLALSEKKSALAERDMAIHQRDSAISERNGAVMERENAIVALQYRQNALKSGAQLMPHHHMKYSPYNSSEIEDIGDPLPLSPSPPPPESSKPKKAKRAKEAASPNKKLPKKKVKKERDEDYGEGSKRSKPNWKDQNLGLNQITYDDSSMPVPVCSCTGVYRPCYKWGSGGWQSSCCTTSLSMYPLPPMPNKKHARIGGRKMSGGAFSKLLTRLASEGYDLSNPVDLKNNWAKHGTNRYITIK